MKSFIDFRGVERQSLFVRFGALLSDKPMPNTVQTLQRGAKESVPTFLNNRSYRTDIRRQSRHLSNAKSIQFPKCGPKSKVFQNNNQIKAIILL